MKFIVLALCLFSMGTAFGQHLHMIEMSTTTSTLGALTFVDDGSRTDKSVYLGSSYAYRLSERVQAGIQGNYSRFESLNTSESYNFMVGGIYNFDDDLTNALYVSLYGGMGWNYYQGTTNTKRETISGRFSLGKRFALSSLNLPNVSYTPEISYTRNEYTESAYGVNILAIRFLQFSVFF